MGICNTFANIPGMVVPSIVEAMTPDVSKISLDIVRCGLDVFKPTLQGIMRFLQNRNLYALLAMITNSAIQSTARTLFTMLF